MSAAAPLRFVARGNCQARARPGVTADGGLGLSAGFADGPWDFQAGAAWNSARDLTAVSGTASMTTTALFLGTVWSGPGDVAPLLAVSTGVEARSYSSGAVPLGVLWTPVATLEAGVRLRIGHAVSLEAGALGQADLGRTLLQVGDAEPVPLSAGEFGGIIALRVGRR